MCSSKRCRAFNYRSKSGSINISLFFFIPRFSHGQWLCLCCIFLRIMKTRVFLNLEIGIRVIMIQMKFYFLNQTWTRFFNKKEPSVVYFCTKRKNWKTINPVWIDKNHLLFIHTFIVPWPNLHFKKNFNSFTCLHAAPYS